MCRTGCPTQNHLSYADCCKGLQINHGEALSHIQKSWNRELDAYSSARRQGVQPDGTHMHQVEKAMRASDASGVAYGVE
jgi:hypothetical protein